MKIPIFRETPIFGENTRFSVKYPIYGENIRFSAKISIFGEWRNPDILREFEKCFFRMKILIGLIGLINANLYEQKNIGIRAGNSEPWRHVGRQDKKNTEFGKRFENCYFRSKIDILPDIWLQDRMFLNGT